MRDKNCPKCKSYMYLDTWTSKPDEILICVQCGYKENIPVGMREIDFFELAHGKQYIDI